MNHRWKISLFYYLNPHKIEGSDIGTCGQSISLKDDIFLITKNIGPYSEMYCRVRPD